MEPTIYKPTICKGNGIYNNGAGGIYNGRGVYKDGAGLFVEIGANVYQYKKINNLFWLVENLREPIGQINTDYKKYNDELLNEFGLYYRFTSLSLLNNILLDGWRVASRNDWNNLINFCGGSSIAGKILKNKSSLWTPNTGTNEKGFNAYPAGDASPNFEHIGTYAHFLTSTSYNSYCYQFYIDANSDGIWSSNGLPQSGYYLPIRLCKDA